HLDVEREARRRGWRGSPIEHPHVFVVLSAAKDLLPRTSRSLAMLGMTAIGQPQSSYNAAMSPVDDYLAHLEVERQVSAHTLDAYRRDLAALRAWTDDRGRDMLALDGEDIRAFVASEHRRGLSPKSLQRRLSACRSLYRWLLKQGRIAASPVEGVRAPKAPRKLPQVLDVDEAVRLVEIDT